MKKIILFLTCTLVILFTTLRSSAQFSLSIGINVTSAPPPLPEYTQPPCPVDGYLWSPGYWAWDDEDGYYWVPGVWITPPQPGYLWTPGYWDYSANSYRWHGGYWATHVGFYGGVNYGYGYGGSGFYGGRWDGGHYRYNTAVVQVNRTVVHNTYIDRTVINNTTINNRVSYNGGAGTAAKPTAQQQQAMRETHVRPTSDQITHNQSAAKDRNQFAVVNKGRPQTAAMDKPGGGRFDTQGKNAPAPVARPTGRVTTGDANRTGNNPTKTNNAAPGNRQPNTATLPVNQPANTGTNANGKQPGDGKPHNTPPVIENSATMHRDKTGDNARRNNDNNNNNARVIHTQTAPADRQPQQNMHKQQQAAPALQRQVQAPHPQNQMPHQPPHQSNQAPRINPPPHNEHPQGEHHR